MLFGKKEVTPDMVMGALEATCRNLSFTKTL